jgi:hypothetical protein
MVLTLALMVSSVLLGLFVAALILSALETARQCADEWPDLIWNKELPGSWTGDFHARGIVTFVQRGNEATMKDNADKPNRYITFWGSQEPMIPDYQTLMLPLLRYVGDGKEHRIADVIDPLANKLGLTEMEKAEMLPSGKQTIFSNRVHWAKTYMAQAKLLGRVLIMVGYHEVPRIYPRTPLMARRT